MRELHFLNSTVIKPIALMKNKKTREVVFNTWFSFLQNNKNPTLFFYNTYFQKNKRLFRIRTLSNKFSNQLSGPVFQACPLGKPLLTYLPLFMPEGLPKGHKLVDRGTQAFKAKQGNKSLVVPEGLPSGHKERQTFLTKQSKPSEKNFPFFNRSFDKKRLKMLFSWYYANRGEAATFSLVETLQKLGFTYAMKAGISLGVDDLKVPPTKGESLTEAVELLANTKASVNSGNVTALEEFQQFVDTWHRTSENLKTSVVQNFSRSSSFLKKKSTLNNFSSLGPEGNPGNREKTKAPLLDLRSLKSKEINPSLLKQVQPYKKKNIFSSKTEEMRSKELAFNEKPNLLSLENNALDHKAAQVGHQTQKVTASYSTILNPVYMMAFSGARGNLSQVRQLVGMRGLMADPQGQLVEFPIQSNFREGLTVTEYMISCYGARKGLVDTALRTAAAGYLTRRLVDVSHHQIVRSVTCGTKGGILLYNEHNKKEQNQDKLLPSAWKVPPYSKASFKKYNTNQSIRGKKVQESAWKNSLLNNSTGMPMPIGHKHEQTFQGTALLPYLPLGVPERLLSGHEEGQAFQSKHSQQDTQLTPLLRKNSQKEKKAPLVFCVGRVLARDIPGIAFRNQEIDISLASSPLLRKVYDTIGIYIRSPLTCKSETGICQLCYGWSVSANRLVGLGEAVGIIAAQSIGEPGTQLTMRTFHTGGVFSGDIMEECRAKHAGVVFFQNVYLGLLVRTAGGAIAFCLKTSAVFQIKGANEITTYTVSANTLLFVRQGEKVSMDSLLAQIPNLPTVEESTGESTKTIVSDLSGEVRQKATVNPELASIRILAGQECKQFYFFNSFGKDARPNKYSPTPMYNKKQLIRTNSLTNIGSRVGPKGGLSSQHHQVDKNKKHLDKGWQTSSQNEKHLLAFQNSKKEIKEDKQTKSLVNLICGTHRLGNNKTFSININGSNSEVVLLAQKAYLAKKPSTFFQESLLDLGKDLNTNLAYPCSLHAFFCPTSTATDSISYLPKQGTHGLVPFFVPERQLQSLPKGLLKEHNNQEKHQDGQTSQVKQGKDLEQVGNVASANLYEQVTQATNIGNVQNGTRDLDYQAHWSVLNVGGFYKVKGRNFKKTLLLRDLRFFVASKIHQNKFSAPLLFKNSIKDSTSLVLSHNVTLLSKVKLCMPSKSHKTSKFSRAMLVISSQKQEYKNQFKNSRFFQLLVYTTKTVQSQKGYPTSEVKSNLASTNKILDYRNGLQNQIKPSSKFFSPYSDNLAPLKLKKFFVDSKRLKQIQPKFNKAYFVKPLGKQVRSFALPLDSSSSYRPSTGKLCTPYKEWTLKVRDKNKTNGAIKQISTLTAWPQFIPPKMVDYAYLFWKLEDLIFFRSNFTKKTQILSKLRISINKHWWGNKNSNSFLCKNIIIKQSKGFELINFLNESRKVAIIKEFPNLLLKLFYRKKETYLNTVEPFQHKRQNKNKALNFVLPMSFNEFVSESSKPRLKIQDSGEIFPLQGNTTLKEFQQKFCSFHGVTRLNSGLLIHYNRISYKIPLCSAYPNVTLSKHQTKTNNSILIKERLSFLRSELAVFALNNFVDPLVKKRKTSSSIRLSNDSQQSQSWEKNNKQDLQKESKSYSSMFGRTVILKSPLVPQIGDFINTGDEVIKDCASAYCGQLIEKSPVGLTLRLTQNILYSNLRNRPAKINKSVKNGYWIVKGAPLVTLPYISNVTGDIVAGIPKIEQLFEARGESLDETVEKIWTSTKFSIVPRSKAVRECFKEIGLFVVAAIQKVYSSQGVHIADKHLEVIIRQMTRRALIVDPGDTEFLPDEFVDLNTIECVNWATYGDTAIYRPQLIGITKASLTSNSFLSSASFQQTARVLERETILEKTDRLLGLKERVMMGALINAGTGELKTSVKLSDRSLAKSVSSKLFQRLGFFSRRKIEINKKLINKQ